MGPAGPGESLLGAGNARNPPPRHHRQHHHHHRNHDDDHDHIYHDHIYHDQDIFLLLPGSQIRRLREEAPSNFATLLYKVADHNLDHDHDHDS